MKRGEDRILTTHTGSLHRPLDLAEMLMPKFGGAPYDEQALNERLTTAVADVVRQQRSVGVDIVNDGEFSKEDFVGYVVEG
jgi:5-methyltetrahydropteroyltriglutamate--homocysteine methyltransferase